jgi:hypothetical protein
VAQLILERIVTPEVVEVDVSPNSDAVHPVHAPADRLVRPPTRTSMLPPVEQVGSVQPAASAS